MLVASRSFAVGPCSPKAPDLSNLAVDMPYVALCAGCIVSDRCASYLWHLKLLACRATGTCSVGLAASGARNRVTAMGGGWRLVAVGGWAATAHGWSGKGAPGHRWAVQCALPYTTRVQSPHAVRNSIPNLTCLPGSVYAPYITCRYRSVSVNQLQLQLPARYRAWPCT